MKKLIALLFCVSLSSLLFAQSSGGNILSQWKFNLSDSHRLDHLLSDDFTDIKVNLQKRSLRISDKPYTLKHIGIEKYLIDQDQNIYAYLLGKKIEVGGKKYTMKGGALYSEEGKVICKIYTRTKKGKIFVGISRSAEVSDLLVGLYFYQQLDSIDNEYIDNYIPGLYGVD